MSDIAPFRFWDDDGKAGLSRVWCDAIQKDPCLTQAVMLVELVTGDQCRFRFSTDLLDGINTIPMLFEEPTVVNNYDLDVGNAASRSVQVSVPSRELDIKSRLTSGAPLSGYGEVSLILPGMDLEDRCVLIRGEVASGFSFGAYGRLEKKWGGRQSKSASESASFTVQDPRSSADFRWPPTLRPDDDVAVNIGEAIPFVFGEATVPAVYYNGDTALPEYVIGLGALNVIQLFLDGVDVTASFTVSQQPVSGHICTVATATIPGVYPEGGGDMFAVVQEAPLSVRQLVERVFAFHPCGTSILNSTLMSDLDSCIPSIELSGFVNNQTTIFQFFEADLADDLQMISWVWDGGKYGPVVTDYTKTPVAELESCKGVLFSRISQPVESDVENVINDILYLFGYDPITDSYTSSVEFNAANNDTLKASSGWYNPKADQFDGLFVHDTASASVVADWLIRHRSAVTYYVQYAACPALFLTLKRGDVVRLTDDDLCWDGVTATVERLEYQRGFLNLGLRVWNNPIRGLPWGF